MEGGVVFLIFLFIGTTIWYWSLSNVLQKENQALRRDIQLLQRKLHEAPRQITSKITKVSFDQTITRLIKLAAHEGTNQDEARNAALQAVRRIDQKLKGEK